jgi:hypothetical protein
MAQGLPLGQEAPLLELSRKDRYEFSIYDRKFNIYLMKISVNGRCIGLLVLQRRNYVYKVLFSYFDEKDAGIAANCLKLQAMRQNIREIICYDEAINKHLKKSSLFLYKTKSTRNLLSQKYSKREF